MGLSDPTWAPACRLNNVDLEVVRDKLRATRGVRQAPRTTRLTFTTTRARRLLVDSLPLYLYGICLLQAVNSSSHVLAAEPSTVDIEIARGEDGAANSNGRR